MKPDASPYLFGIDESYASEDDLRPDALWITVRAGDVPCPLRLRLAKGRGGRMVVTELEVLGEGEEITSETLRAIRLPKIIAALFAGFDPSRPPPNPGTDLGKDDDALPVDQAAWINHLLFRTFVYDILPESPALTEEEGELTLFALTYKKNLAAQPNRAMTATAEDLHIGRATANRRAAECRRRGLLPQPGSDAR